MSAETVIPTAAEQAQRLEKVSAELLEIMSTPAAIQAWRSAEPDEEWSVTEVLGHMLEMIPYWLASCQAIGEASESPGFGRALDDPERLAAVAQGAKISPQTFLILLQREIQQASITIRTMSDSQRAQTGIHILRGRMSVAEIVESLIVAHAENHLTQIRTILATSTVATSVDK